MSSKEEAPELKMPKRATPAYIYFSMDFRNSLEADGNTNNEIMKAAAIKWKKMTDAQKKPYLEMEIKDKLRYCREVKAYRKKVRTNTNVGKTTSQSGDSAGQESSSTGSVDESFDESDNE